MSLFVDTSAWSLTLRRDAEQGAPEVAALRDVAGSGLRASLIS